MIEVAHYKLDNQLYDDDNLIMESYSGYNNNNGKCMTYNIIDQVATAATVVTVVGKFVPEFS